MSFIVLTVPAFALLGTGNFLVIVLVQILLGAMLTLNDGTLPSFLAEMFPTRVRYSGFAVSFNLSNALFGGTAPFMATLLIAATANDLAPAWYLVGCRGHLPDRRRTLQGNLQRTAAPRVTQPSPIFPSQVTAPQKGTTTMTTTSIRERHRPSPNWSA